MQLRAADRVLSGKLALLATLWPTIASLAAGCSEPEELRVSTPPHRKPARTAPSAEPAAAPGASGRGTLRENVPAYLSVATKPEPVARVYAKTRFVWIRPEPRHDTQWIGYMWTGGSVALKSDVPVTGAGCRAWYAVEPRGYVCVDGKRATLNGDDPVLARLRPYVARLDTPWPHRYAESNGAELYKALPSSDEQKRREWDLTDHLGRLERARKGDIHPTLAGVDPAQATGKPFELLDLPSTIHEARERLRPRSTVAYSEEVYANGRSWLFTADFRWFPKDRAKPYPVVEFRGVELGEGVSLPLAFFRSAERPKYRRTDAGFELEGSTWPRLSWVKLTDRRIEQEGRTFLETADGQWVDAEDAVVPSPRDKTPWGASVGAKDETGLMRGRRTWLQASIWGGWLIAYEGTRPVYVTLISPGRGGTPVPGKDPLETASTPTGRFPITGKFATATMVAPHEFVHSDVPWTQNFSGPHALHGAYWHDDWGRRKSAGCINVSPEDGRWLFAFTEPPLPEGWHGVRWLPSLEPATTFIVHD
jgi:hypothetical protein